MRRLITVAAAAMATMLIAAPAFAHFSANPGTAPAGSFTVIEFTPGHGCDGSPTRQVTVQIPEGVTSVAPEFDPHWPVEMTKEGEEVTAVTWTAASEDVVIPGDLLYSFSVSMKMPETPGETLYFPTIQTCTSGEIAWINIPAEGQGSHDIEDPAPAVTLVEAEAEHDHDEGGEKAEGGDDHESEADSTQAAEDTATEAPQAPDESDSDGSDGAAAALVSSPADGGPGGLAIAALMIALLALGVGAAGFLAARRSS